MVRANHVQIREARMMKRNGTGERLALAIAAFMICSTACEDDRRAVPVPSAEREGPAQLVVDVGGFAPIDMWRVGPAHAGADGSPMQRVGAMVGVTDGQPVELAVRANETSEWLVMTPLASMGMQQVFSAALPEAANELQIGIRESDHTRISFVRWTGAANGLTAFETRTDQPATMSFAGVPITPRGGWSAAPSRCDAREDETESGKHGVSLHMTATPGDWPHATSMQALQAYFTSGLGFCDLGFHFVVAGDGTIYEGRPLHLAGAHGSSGQVVIGFLGCFDSMHCPLPDDVSAAAKTSVQALIRSLSQLFMFEVNPTSIVAPTCTAASADCAGDRLAAAASEIVESMPPTGMDGGISDSGPEPDAMVPTGPTRCNEMGCDWCNSTGTCLAAGESCAWVGEMSGDRCWSTVDACTALSCWEPTLNVPRCSTTTMPEDFSSGRFALHRYETSLQPGGPVTISLTRTGGTWQPALLLTDMSGALISAGDVTTRFTNAPVGAATSGQSGNVASVTLTPSTALNVRVHVTSWAVINGGFSGMLPTDATYTLMADQSCDTPPMTSASESVGTPQNGSLENGVRIGDHPGYVVASSPVDAHYGTEETIRWIREAFDAVVAMHPTAARAAVHEISIREGGVPTSGPWNHNSHESGRDADITYILNSCGPQGCPFTPVVLSQFDVAANWTMMEYWLRNDMVTYIFVDHGLQQSLYEEAQRRGATESQLAEWIQWPRAAEIREGKIRDVVNHRNHLHVRFRCPDDDTRCEE